MAAAPYRTIARLLPFLFVVLIPASTTLPTHHTYLSFMASRPNGADDVLYVLAGTFVIRDLAGNIAGGAITATAPGGTFNLYDDGGTNTCQLQINANGEVTVQRTAGSCTFKVMLDLIWL